MNERRRGCHAERFDPAEEESPREAAIATASYERGVSTGIAAALMGVAFGVLIMKVVRR